MVGTGDAGYRTTPNNCRRYPMKALVMKKLIAILILGLFSSLALAQSDMGKQATPVQTVAKILFNLNHYPSDKEKEKLRAIADNRENSKAIQTIAMAIHNMQHSVSASDKGKLQAIIDSADASKSEKTLAEILIGITHMPGNEAKDKLSELKK
jgi:hypothetical protein